LRYSAYFNYQVPWTFTISLVVRLNTSKYLQWLHPLQVLSYIFSEIFCLAYFVWFFPVQGWLISPLYNLCLKVAPLCLCIALYLSGLFSTQLLEANPPFLMFIHFSGYFSCAIFIFYEFFFLFTGHWEKCLEQLCFPDLLTNFASCPQPY
jgi:hypothetical protein